MIDVGSHALKVIVFNKGDSASLDLPKPVKKVFMNLPVAFNKSAKPVRTGVSRMADGSVTLPPDISGITVKSRMSANGVKSAGVGNNALFIAHKLRELIFFLVKELERVPAELIVGVSPSFSESVLETWSTTNVGSLKTASRSEVGRIFQTLFKEHQEDKNVIFVTPVEILINGYAVSLDKVPIYFSNGSPIQEISFRTLVLRFPEEAGKQILGLQRSFGGLKIDYIPLVAAHATSISTVMSVEDALIVDIGGEETTLSLLFRRKLRAVTYFSLGVHHFLRNIAETMSVSFEEAEDLKRQYAQDVLPEAKKTVIQDIFAKEAVSWENLFMSALESFFALEPLPREVFVIGGGAYIQELISVLRKPDWMKRYSHVSSPVIRIASAQSFFEGNSLNGFLQGPEEAGLASLMLYSLYHQSLLYE